MLTRTQHAYSRAVLTSFSLFQSSRRGGRLYSERTPVESASARGGGDSWTASAIGRDDAGDGDGDSDDDIQITGYSERKGRR
jgi:hypothetical protein